MKRKRKLLSSGDYIVVQEKDRKRMIFLQEFFKNGRPRLKPSICCCCRKPFTKSIASIEEVTRICNPVRRLDEGKPTKGTDDV